VSFYSWDIWCYKQIPLPYHIHTTRHITMMHWDIYFTMDLCFSCTCGTTQFYFHSMIWAYLLKLYFESLTEVWQCRLNFSNTLSLTLVFTDNFVLVLVTSYVLVTAVPITFTFITFLIFLNAKVSKAQRSFIWVRMPSPWYFYRFSLPCFNPIVLNLQTLCEWERVYRKLYPKSFHSTLVHTSSSRDKIFPSFT
jgi:hypothetical protein